jgi:hypothetical protein
MRGSLTWNAIGEVGIPIFEISANVKIATTPLTENKDEYLCIY